MASPELPKWQFVTWGLRCGSLKLFYNCNLGEITGIPANPWVSGNQTTDPHRCPFQGSSRSASEPLGGAHRDPIKTGENLKASIIGHLAELEQLEIEELLAQRYTRLQEFGQFNESA